MNTIYLSIFLGIFKHLSALFYSSQCKSFTFLLFCLSQSIFYIWYFINCILKILNFFFFSVYRHSRLKKLILHRTNLLNLLIHSISFFVGPIGFGAILGLRRWRICLQCRRPGFKPSVRKIPWQREWLPTPVFMHWEFHRLKSLEGIESQRVGHTWVTNTFIGFYT